MKLRWCSFCRKDTMQVEHKDMEGRWICTQCQSRTNEDGDDDA